MNSTKIALIVLYVLIMIASITMYGLWLASNNINDEVTQLVLLIILGYLFLSSIQWYVMFEAPNYPAIIGIVMFASLTIFTIIQSNMGITSAQNGYIYRNWAIGLGIGTIVPVLTIIIGDLMKRCNGPASITDAE